MTSPAMNLSTGLQNGTLEFAIMVQPAGDQAGGIQFEVLRTYPLCVAMTTVHPFARMKSIPLEKLAAEPLVVYAEKSTPSLMATSTAFLPPSAPNHQSRWNVIAPVH
jgi:DNA-binding transcriptional LysR family regulator